MSFRLNEYKKHLSTAIIKEAKSLLDKKSVRELDEEEEGKYVAYVDVAHLSYDVQLNIDKEGNILSHQCDCGNEYFFCEHKTAVLLHMLTIGKSITSVKVKKVNKALELFNTMSKEQLGEWLLLRFKEDKVLRLAFDQHFFSSTEQELRADEVEAKLSEITKIVIGRQRKINAATFKKLFHMWLPILEQIKDALWKNPFQKSYHDTYIVSFSYLIFFHNYNSYSSVLLKNYIKKEFDFNEQMLDGLSDEAWKKVVDIIYVFQFHGDANIKNLYNSMIYSSHTQKHSERYDYVVARSMEGLFGSKSPIKVSSSSLANFFINSQNSSHLASYIQYFKLFPKNDEANTLLFKKWNEYGMYDKCIQEKSKFVFTYDLHPEIAYEIAFALKQIGEHKQFFRLANEIMIKKPSYSMYQQLMALITDKHLQKEWRDGLLSSFKIMYKSNRKARHCYYELLIEDEQYSKLFSLNCEVEDLPFFLNHFSLIFRNCKDELLSYFLSLQMPPYSYYTESLKNLIDDCAHLIFEKYSKGEIQEAITSANELRHGYYMYPINSKLDLLLEDGMRSKR